MLAATVTAANSFPFPVAAAPLTPAARDALPPARRGAPWLTAAVLDRAVDFLDLSCLHRLYRRRGSLPFSPLLMLTLALFCMADGLPSPPTGPRWPTATARAAGSPGGSSPLPAPATPSATASA